MGINLERIERLNPAINAFLTVAAEFALAAARAAEARHAEEGLPPFWGVPIFSLPLSVDPDGLPIGIQLVGRPSAEATLLRLAAELEAAHPWRALRPGLA